MLKTINTKLPVFNYVIIASIIFINIISSSYAEQDGSNIENQVFKKVQSSYVCMVTNKLFNKEQIPVEVEGKMYYGCCEMCKGTLENDPNSRVAVDPISGKSVDKALSVTATNSDGSVYYFENEKNLREFNNKIIGEN